VRLPVVDRQLAGISLALIVYGLIVLYSAGQTDVPTPGRGVWERQIVWVVLGLLAAWGAFRLSPRLLEWITPAIYGFSLVLLVLVLLVGTGAGTAASSHAWLAIGTHQIGQPSELAKLATVFMLARHLSGRREPPRSLRDLVGPTLIVGMPALMVIREPDLGSGIVFIGIFFAMLFWAGVRPRLLFLLASPVASLLLAFTNVTWGFWIVGFTLVLVAWRPYVWDGLTFWMLNVAMGMLAIPLWRRLKPYQQDRLLTFLNPEVDPQRAGYHALQSKVAIGSGGWFGTGYTQGPQKRLAFLPEQHTDFVFSVVGEELGFVGVAVALALFAALFLTLIRIARRATDPFSSLMVFGILGIFFSHVFENVGMTVNIMPITGIPLPFFSYGGSFFIICAVCLGLAFRVAWDARQAGYIES
jgi:rod shape determining protein RodA